MALELEVWQAPIVDSEGNIQPGAQVTVFNSDDTIATIYDDLNRTPRSNPFNVGSDALARFYAEPGRYRVQAQVGSDIAVFDDVDLSQKALREDLADPESEALIAGEPAKEVAALRSDVSREDAGSLIGAFGSIKDLFASTIPSSSIGKRWVAEGKYFYSEADAEDSSEWLLETAGGVKLLPVASLPTAGIEFDAKQWNILPENDPTINTENFNKYMAYMGSITARQDGTAFPAAYTNVIDFGTSEHVFNGHINIPVMANSSNDTPFITIKGGSGHNDRRINSTLRWNSETPQGFVFDGTRGATSLGGMPRCRVTFDGVHVRGPGRDSGVSFYRAKNLIDQNLTDFSCDYFDVGMHLIEYGYGSVWKSVSFMYCNVGLRCQHMSGTSWFGGYVRHCTVGIQRGDPLDSFGSDIDNGRSFSLYNVLFASNRDAAMDFVSPRMISLFGCYGEGNKLFLRLRTSSSANINGSTVYMVGCSFNAEDVQGESPDCLIELWRGIGGGDHARLIMESCVVNDRSTDRVDSVVKVVKGNPAHQGRFPRFIARDCDFWGLNSHNPEKWYESVDDFDELIFENVNGTNLSLQKRFAPLDIDRLYSQSKRVAFSGGSVGGTVDAPSDSKYVNLNVGGAQFRVLHDGFTINDCLAFWDLSEESGNRLDKQNGYELLDSGDVGQEDGVGSGQFSASFAASETSQLSMATPADLLDFSKDKTIFGWFKHNTDLGIGNSVVLNIPGVLSIGPRASSQRTRLTVTNSLSSQTNIEVLNTWANREWSFFLADYNATTKRWRLFDIASGNEAGATISEGMNETPTGNMFISANGSAGFRGEVAAIGFMDRRLSPAEQQWLYQNGSRSILFDDMPQLGATVEQ